MEKDTFLIAGSAKNFKGKFAIVVQKVPKERREGELKLMPLDGKVEAFLGTEQLEYIVLQGDGLRPK